MSKKQVVVVKHQGGCADAVRLIIAAVIIVPLLLVGCMVVVARMEPSEADTARREREWAIQRRAEERDRQSPTTSATASAASLHFGNSNGEVWQGDDDYERMHSWDVWSQYEPDGTLPVGDGIRVPSWSTPPAQPLENMWRMFRILDVNGVAYGDVAHYEDRRPEVDGDDVVVFYTLDFFRLPREERRERLVSDASFWRQSFQRFGRYGSGGELIAANPRGERRYMTDGERVVQYRQCRTEAPEPDAPPAEKVRPEFAYFDRIAREAAPRIIAGTLTTEGTTATVMARRDCLTMSAVERRRLFTMLYEQWLDALEAAAMDTDDAVLVIADSMGAPQFRVTENGVRHAALGGGS